MAGGDAVQYQVFQLRAGQSNENEFLINLLFPYVSCYSINIGNSLKIDSR